MEKEDIKITEQELELLSEEIHKIYCKQYIKINRKEYWTKKDYFKLNEETKEFDRVNVRFMIKMIEGCCESQRKICNDIYNEFSDDWEIGLSEKIENANFPNIIEIFKKIVSIDQIPNLE